MSKYRPYPQAVLGHLYPQAGVRPSCNAHGASWYVQSLALFSSDDPRALPPILGAPAGMPWPAQSVTWGQGQESPGRCLPLPWPGQATKEARSPSPLPTLLCGFSVC